MQRAAEVWQLKAERRHAGARAPRLTAPNILSDSGGERQLGIDAHVHMDGERPLGRATEVFDRVTTVTTGSGTGGTGGAGPGAGAGGTVDGTPRSVISGFPTSESARLSASGAPRPAPSRLARLLGLASKPALAAHDERKALAARGLAFSIRRAQPTMEQVSQSVSQ